MYKKILLILTLLTLLSSNFLVRSAESMRITCSASRSEYYKLIQHDEDTDIYNLITKSKDEPVYVKGEIIVKFKERCNIIFVKTSKGIITGEKSLNKINNKYNLKSIENLNSKNSSGPLSNLFKLIFPDDIDIFEIIKYYSQLPIVEYVEPNYIYHYCLEPNDPLFSLQWSLKNIGQEYPWDGRFNPPPGTPDSDIDASEAWDINTGGSDIVVAVIDTGVDYNHPDLVNNIWSNNDEIPNNGIDDDSNGFVDDVRGWDFQRQDNDPMDEYGHGTFCAGIISAVGNNGKGISGVCWNCKIMPIKTLLTSSKLAEAIVYAADNGADVISMSWGGYSYSQLQKDALDYAYNRNVVLIASAGNDNNSRRHYPSGYDNVISVAATDSNDKKAVFSNYGPWIDVAAPGVDILSLRAKNTDMYGDATHIFGKYYYVASGTSMASPYISGIAALLLSHNDSLTPDMIKTIILNSADELSSSSFYIGGRANAHQALQKKPAVVLLEQYVDWKNIKGTISIKGMIWSEDFEKYTLEYGKGENPETWTTILEEYHPREGILANLDTTQLDEGVYTIRLRVNCNDDIYQDKIWIVVNNKRDTIYVDDDNQEGPWTGSLEYPYKNIQDGINSVGAEDTVFVYNGTYYENIKITTSIKLIGEDKNSTIIDSNKSGSSITVLSNNIIIKGFKIQNCEKSTSEAGIKFGKDIKNVTINNNTIVDCYCGIYLSGDNNNKIQENILKNSTILLFKANQNNIISKNIILESEGNVGIGLSISYFNIIANNTIANHKYGILIGFSIQNFLINNNISKNDIGVAFFIWGMHKIYNNNFIKNKVHALAINSRFNNWEGNYWDNWIGLNRPYLKFLPKIIPSISLGITNNIDWHPAKVPYNIC